MGVTKSDRTRNIICLLCVQLWKRWLTDSEHLLSSCTNKYATLRYVLKTCYAMFVKLYYWNYRGGSGSQEGRGSLLGQRWSSRGMANFSPLEGQIIRNESPENRTWVYMFRKVRRGWCGGRVGLSRKPLFTNTFVWMLFTEVVILRGVDLLCLLNCIIESIQGTVGYRSLHGGPHVGQFWSRITECPACS